MNCKSNYKKSERYRSKETRLGEQSKPGVLTIKTQTTRVEILCIYRGVPNRCFGIRDLPYLKLGIRFIKQNRGGGGGGGGDSGLNVCAGGRVANITLGITGLPGILGRDYEIEELYWGPSKD